MLVRLQAQGFHQGRIEYTALDNDPPLWTNTTRVSLVGVKGGVFDADLMFGGADQIRMDAKLRHPVSGMVIHRLEVTP